MVLGKLDTYVQKNEIEPQFYTTHKNFELLNSSGGKRWGKAPWYDHGNNFFGHDTKSTSNKSKLVKLQAKLLIIFYSDFKYVTTFDL